MDASRFAVSGLREAVVYGKRCQWFKGYFQSSTGTLLYVGNFTCGLSVKPENLWEVVAKKVERMKLT